MDPLNRRLLKRLALAALAAALAYWLVGAAAEPISAAVCAVLAAALILVLAYDSDLRERASDIDRLQRINIDLAQQAARDEVRQLIEAVAEPLLIVDRELIVLRANAAGRALLGAGIEGETLTVFLRQPGAVEAIQSVSLTGQPAEGEVQFLSPTEGTFAVRANVLNLDDGRILVAMRDVTKSRLMERMRVDFVANASHELRTPLATLIGFIETLQGPASEDKAARVRFLDIMAQEAARMARLIDDLLSLSRIELDKHVRPSTPLDLRPLLTQVGQTLAMRLEADSRRIEQHIPESLPPVIADRDQILQVLHNLVSNALKYGRSGTSITLTVSVVDSPPSGQLPHVRIEVADQGEGIAPEHLPRLTERFYRVDTARSRQMGGTGLGLAIVKHIVEKHRGEMQVSSTLGVGTTVAFTLPLAGRAGAGDGGPRP
ncbi:sensor histidine kinase [Parapedomonas caeni]